MADILLVQRKGIEREISLTASPEGINIRLVRAFQLLISYRTPKLPEVYYTRLRVPELQ